MNKKNNNDSLKIASNIEFLDGLRCAEADRRYEVFKRASIEEAKVLRSFNNDYIDCLEIARTWRRMTYKDIQEATELSEKTISRTFRRETVPSPENLALICFALRLPYRLSSHIFNCSPCNLTTIHWDKKRSEYDYTLYILDALLERLAGQPMDVVASYFEAYGFKRAK